MAERARQRRDLYKDLKAQESTWAGSAIPRSAEGSRAILSRLYQAVALVLVGMLWLVSLPLIDPRRMTDIGLLSVLPITFYIALGILTVNFYSIAFFQPARRGFLIAHLAVLILLIHATPALVYGTLRYSWAWKHVGIVDYIQRHGGIDPTISFLNAYHNWPGFFALNTLLTQSAGLESAQTYARWAPLFFNLLYLGALLLIYPSLTRSRRIVWLATWFFFISDWIGQDYFAPQSFAYFFYLVLIGILLRWFRFYPEVNQQSDDRTSFDRSPGKKLLRIWQAMRKRIPARGTVQPSTHMQRAILFTIVILSMMIITFSHQLTPLMTFSALLFLTLFGSVYLRSLPVFMAVLVLTWMWFMASSFVGENTDAIISSFGSLKSNVSENLINLRQASEGQQIVAIMGRSVTLLVILLGGVGFIRRLSNGRFDLVAVLLGIVPIPILVGNSYGGEILFRIYFFALPFMAFFIAGLFVPTPRSGRNAISLILAALVSGVILSGFLFGYYGKEKQYYFTPGEVSATNYLYDTALPGSLIIEGTRNYPQLFKNYELYTYVPIDREPKATRLEMVHDPAGLLTSWMTNQQYPAAYVLITRSMKAEVDMVGTLPAGSLDTIEQKLRQSGQFEVIYANADAAIYVMKDRHR